MVIKNLLATKLSELAQRCERIRARVPPTVDALARDRDALDIVALNLILAVQVCTDIASHFISDEGWASAQTLGQGFTRLEQQGVFQRASRRA